MTGSLLQPSFLIRKSPDQRSFASFPELIAGYHVLRRFSMPRHPPCTLKSLTTFTDHRPNDRPGVSCPGRRRACGGTASLRVRETHEAGPTGNGSTFRQKRCSTTPARHAVPNKACRRRERPKPSSGGRGYARRNHGGCRGGPSLSLLPEKMNLEPQKIIHLSKNSLAD